MILTQKLRDHAVANLGVAADASDDVMKSAIAGALVSGKIDTKTIDSLTAEDDPRRKVEDLVSSAVDARMGVFEKSIKETIASLLPQPAASPAPNSPPPAPEGGYQRNLPVKEIPSDPMNLLSQGQREEHLRVKKASERYDGTKSAATWNWKADGHNSGDMANGMPAFIMERSYDCPDAPAVKRVIDNPSKKEWAKIAACFKHGILRDVPEMRAHMSMNEHEMELLKEAAHEDEWVGTVPGNEFTGRRMLKDFDVKAVLDESGASAGQEAVPIYYDDAIIRTPLLSGELFPYVEVVPISRGSRVHGVSIGTPTFVTTAEGSAITPFSTTTFNVAFDVNIYPASVVFEWGLDFEGNAFPNYIENVIAQIGEQAKKQLDYDIAVGDGTTQPQGVFIASGTVVPGIGTHTGSSLTYADIVNLAFGIDKAARNAFGGSALRFIMNDREYKYLWSIATGVTGDTRPVFANPTFRWDSYQLGDRPVSVQNDISFGNLCICNLRGYRLYRRQGLSFIMDETGRTNRLAHQKLLLGRMRWGGKITLAATYIGEMTT